MEKKKLSRSVNTQTAAGQELALEALNAHLKQKSVPPSTTVENDEKMAENENEPTKIEKSAAVKNKTKKNVVVKRLNMDIPQDLYEKIESEIDETGQTVKGFFVMLAKNYFKNK
jgi:predicted RNA-binding protein YlxR (DUF448 family)